MSNKRHLTHGRYLRQVRQWVEQGLRVLRLVGELLLTHPARWQRVVHRWRRDNDPDY